MGSVTAIAAEIKVLCTSAITPIMAELVPRFERATGHTLAIRYDFGPVLQRQIAAGEAFNVAILSLDVEDLIRQGKVAAGSRTVLGRTGVGVGVRKGAPKPDISTTAAFRRTLLDAKSVAYSREGASGLYFLGLLERLGIAEEMKAKLRPSAADNTVGSVASGEVEMVVVGDRPHRHGARRRARWMAPVRAAALCRVLRRSERGGQGSRSRQVAAGFSDDAGVARGVQGERSGAG